MILWLQNGRGISWGNLFEEKVPPNPLQTFLICYSDLVLCGFFVLWVIFLGLCAVISLFPSADIWLV